MIFGFLGLMALEVLNVDMALKVLSLCVHVDSLIVFLLVFSVLVLMIDHIA